MIDLSCKVTKIKNRWHARLIEGDTVHAEMACAERLDIGYICRQLMRWHDKTGQGGVITAASRNRLNTKADNYRGPVGKIWESSFFMSPQMKGKAND